MLPYIKYVLYRLEKIKIVFKYYLLIDSKLCQSMFDYFKFYAINYFG